MIVRRIPEAIRAQSDCKMGENAEEKKIEAAARVMKRKVK